jgi:hypothetical protein
MDRSMVYGLWSSFEVVRLHNAKVGLTGTHTSRTLGAINGMELKKKQQLWCERNSSKS